MKMYSTLPIFGLAMLFSLALGPFELRAAEDTATGELRADLSAKEMAAETKKLLAEMEGFHTRTLVLQGSARKAKDVIKLNCVNENLLAVKQLLNLADNAENDLSEAIASSDRDAQVHQYSQIKLAHERAISARDEAEGCIGEELNFVGKRDVEWEVTPVPDDNVDGPVSDEVPFDTPEIFPLLADGALENQKEQNAQVKALQAAGLLPSKGAFTEEDVTKAQAAYDLLDRTDKNRLQELKEQVQASAGQVQLSAASAELVDRSQQKGDAFYGKNWVDRNGDVVQHSSTVLRPDSSTVQKVEYSYRATGPYKGTSIFSDKLRFNQPLPNDWTAIYGRVMADKGQITSTLPDYWLTLQQVSFIAPSSDGCVLCFTNQYLAPGPVPGGGFGQPRSFHLQVGLDSGPTVLASQTWDAAGTLQAGSSTVTYSGGVGDSSVLVNGTSVLDLRIDLSSDLGRKLEGATLLNGLSSLGAYRSQLGDKASGAKFEVKLHIRGIDRTLDMMVNLDALAEAF